MMRTGKKRQGKIALAIWGIVGLCLASDFLPFVYPSKTLEPLQGAVEAVWLADSEENNRKGQAVQQSSFEEKTIALTFDDGPHPIYTPKLLDGLRERGVRVTFFLIGQNIDGNEDIIRQMKEDGHLIGNHSQNHMQLTKEQSQEACDQITRTNEKIKSITGKQPEYVRPPYGSWSEELECIVPMRVVLWNVDPLDWKIQNTSRIVRHIVSHVEDGSIILLHDVYDTSVDAALEVIDTLSKEGYNFVTVDELLIE